MYARQFWTTLREGTEQLKAVIFYQQLSKEQSNGEGNSGLAMASVDSDGKYGGNWLLP